MKICYVNDQLFPNQETDGEQIIQTVSTLSRNGADVTFLLPCSALGKGRVDCGELSEAYRVEMGCAVRQLRGAFPSPRLIEKLGHGLRAALCSHSRGADVVYTRNIPTVVATLLLTGRPVLYETYRNWPDQLPLTAPFFRGLGRRRRFLGAVLHSRLAASSYERAGVPSEKLFARHNGFDPDSLQPAMSKEEARRLLSLPLERRIVTYSGNVSAGKGIGLVLELAKRSPEALFLVVGTKPGCDIAEAASRVPNVRTVPWMAYKDTIPYLYASDVLLIPPTLGPLKKVGDTVLPIKTFVYMAVGRAILAADAPDVKEVLEHGGNAYLVTPDDPDAALEGLRKLLDDAELRERLGRRAAEQAQAMSYVNRSRDIIAFLRRRLEDAGLAASRERGPTTE